MFLSPFPALLGKTMKLSFAVVQVEQTGRSVEVSEESARLLAAVPTESKRPTGRPAPTGGSPTRSGAALTRLSHLSFSNVSSGGFGFEERCRETSRNSFVSKQR